jgi:FKBP-type peptidyl-prolyl cis-trans isomerase 2
MLDLDYNWVALKNSMKKCGIKTPLVLLRRSNAVVDGNHRLAIAKLIYNPNYKIPCVYDDEVKFLLNYKPNKRKKRE